MRWRLLSSLLVLLMALLPSLAAAQSCRWDGTSPFCSGACREGESEHTRLASLPAHWQAAFPVLQNTDFGADCLTGSKALCCQTRSGSECRWDGTAPFCDGSCGAGEQQQTPPEGSIGGAACVTGSKVYCCRSNTGLSRAALRTNPGLVNFSALWVKASGPAWQARHGLSSQTYQQTFDDLVRQGYRPVMVRGYGFNGGSAFAAVFELRQGPPFVARHNLTREEYQREFDHWTREGYRLMDVDAHVAAGIDRYAAIFEKVQGPAFRAYHGIPASTYQREFDRAIRDGYRPVRISGYFINGDDHYAAIFEKREGPAFVARHRLTDEQYQREFDHWGRQGYRLVQLSSWKSGAAGRYAALWEKLDGAAWQARHNLLGDRYQEEFDKLSTEGYRLREVSAFHLYE